MNLESYLKKPNGKIGIHFGCDPKSEALVDVGCLQDGIHDFIAEGKGQMAILQEKPSSLTHAFVQESPAMDFLALAHRYTPHRCRKILITSF